MNKVIHGDCLKVLDTIDQKFQLIFADPPFNIGKKYNDDYDDSRKKEDYKEWTYSWIDKCINLLDNGGVFVIHNIPKNIIWISNYLLDKLDFQNLIAWEANTWPISNRLLPTHYSFSVFSKGKPKTFNRFGDMVEHKTCRHCNGLLADWGGKEKYRNKDGKRVSDVWTDIERIRHNKNKNRKGVNELPEKITDRFVKLYTNEGDLCLDPFSGTETLGASAKRLKRDFILIEENEDDFLRIVERLK